ncbi:MAG: CsgG/HfaB family protein [bacterium]
MTRIARFVSLAAAVAGLVAPLAAHAQKEGKPTVAILYFNNGSFGPSAKDYDGLNKGIPDFLITEMSVNPNIRVIERDQVVKLLDEQKLASDGKIDQATAVKVGKLLGAQHMIFGGYMADTKGNFRIDARAVNVETSAIEHVDRVDDKVDNIMAAISTLAGKLNTGMHLPAMPARRTGDASPASGAQQAGSPAPTPKLPMRVAVMYGKALDAKDHGERSKAVEYFNAVLKEFPNYEPASKEKASLSKGT